MEEEDKGEEGEFDGVLKKDTESAKRLAEVRVVVRGDCRVHTVIIEYTLSNRQNGLRRCRGHSRSNHVSDQEGSRGEGEEDDINRTIHFAVSRRIRNHERNRHYFALAAARAAAINGASVFNGCSKRRVSCRIQLEKESEETAHLSFVEEGMHEQLSCTRTNLRVDFETLGEEISEDG